MTRSEFRAAYTPSKAVVIPTDYMLIPYRLDGRYAREDAVRVYRSEKLADKAANKLYKAGDYSMVVRPCVRVSLATVEG